MITSTVAKTTYTVVEGVTNYAIGFEFDYNPDSTPQIKVYKNKLSETPLVFGTDYTISPDNLNIVVSAELEAGDRLDIIRNIPLRQLSDYIVGRIDPEQIENDFDASVMRDQQLAADLDFLTELPEDHEARIQNLETEVDEIQDLIPTQATPENQLADKDFVNSSIGTSTATFRGTYNSLAELEAVEADENDYGFVISTDTAGNTVYNRYKYNGNSWVFEYALNNSSFTAAQWAAINSGITQSLVTKLTNMPCLISSISANSSTGVITVTTVAPITSISVKKLYGGTTIPGTSSINGTTATFTPTTAASITVEDWVIEVI